VDSTANAAPSLPRRTLRRRVARTLLRIGQTVLLPVALYLLAVLVGLIPVNNDFAPTPDGVEVTVTSPNGTYKSASLGAAGG
jgi:hypothetical protein